MNGVDAKCRQIQIKLTETNVVIEDDGRGITQREHIDKFFRTFGQPHEESEGKVYGTFRMGRGQLFAFGKNIWRTGPFIMDVDIKQRGLRFNLVTAKKKHDGCRIDIDLYTKLMPSNLAETVRQLEEWVKYAPVPVFLNGNLISRDVTKEKWDHTTPEAYIRLDRDRRSLSVYNLGIHTMDMGTWQLGTGGVIVSRQQIKVNFARNDVQSDCKVWQKIRPFVDMKAKQAVAKKATLTDGERRRLIERIRQDDIPDNAADLKIFTAVNGRHFSASQVAHACYQYRKRMCHAPSGKRVGDKVFQQRLAFVMATETLERFGVDKVKKLLPYIHKLYDSSGGYRSGEYTAVKFSSISKSINDSYDLFDEKDLTVLERVWKDLAHYCYCELTDENYDARRRIIIGKSDGANGWTDGSTYIAINRDYLKARDFTFQDVIEVATLVLHERCHDCNDTTDHDHGHEFYQLFHDLSRDKLGKAVQAMWRRLPLSLQTESRKLGRAGLKDADNIVRSRQALEESLARLVKKEKELCVSKP